jgi:hypothetical protein
MLGRVSAAVILLAGLQSCVVYEYEHEFWIRVDGSGSVNVTGRPALWSAFKGLHQLEGADASTTLESVRALFERSGLRVRRVTLTRRRGHPILFVSADFSDFNSLGGTPAFPDLSLSLSRDGERLRLSGTWSPQTRVPVAARAALEDRSLMAVRFHLPSRVYEHKNAFAGVERGNIVAWRQSIGQALEGSSLEVGAVIDRRSILKSTIGLFAGAIVGGVGVLALALYLVHRKGRRERRAAQAEVRL